LDIQHWNEAIENNSSNIQRNIVLSADFRNQGNHISSLDVSLTDSVSDFFVFKSHLDTIADIAEPVICS